MVTPQVLDEIRNKIILSGRDNRYKIGAYDFVLQGLDFYHTKTGEKRHFKGEELAKGLIDFAHKQYGPLAFSLLEFWGIHSTNDLGYIVYNLIDIKLIRKQESDSLEDFFDVVNIKHFFNNQDNYQIDKAYIKSIKGA
jgi:uncharacterized repeat protein (TIGR04138 family)